MRVGVALPNCREGKVYQPGLVTADVLRDVAQTAERAGFDALWANDLHTTFDEMLGTDEHEPPNFYEALTSLAFVAAHTERVDLVTSALTITLRDPILLAKQLATLDQLSKGRLLVGLGLGGKRTELDRLRGRASAGLNRGRWLDESLEVLTALLEQRSVTHDGEYFSINGAEMYPKPVRRPLPLYLTGAGDEMLRRTATYGRGWIHMHVTPEQLAERIEALNRACDTAGTDADRIEKCVQFDVLIAPTEAEARASWAGSPAEALSAARGRSAESSYLIGTPADVVERVRTYRDAGLEHVAFIPTASSSSALLDQIELIGSEVIPHLR